MVSNHKLIEGLLSETRRIFLDCVWPLWRHRSDATNVFNVEDSDRGIDRAADKSGTDAFLVRNPTGILVPIASRIEFFDEQRNNPYDQYYDHYPRFTVRLAIHKGFGEYTDDVECKKRMQALDDKISRRFLPLWTFQSLVKRSGDSVVVLQTSRVDTIEFFKYVREKRLFDRNVGTVSETNKQRDLYRLITAEKLRRASIVVQVLDGDGNERLGSGWLRREVP